LSSLDALEAFWFT